MIDEAHRARHLLPAPPRSLAAHHPRAPGARAWPGASCSACRGGLWPAGVLSRVGPVTAAVTRDLALAAAVDVTCEWKVIVVGPLGQAVAVAKVRRAPVGAGGGGSGSAPVTGRGGHVRAAPGVVGRITLTIPA